MLTDPIPGINDVFEILGLDDPIPSGTSLLGDTGLGAAAALIGAGDGQFNALDLIGAYLLPNEPERFKQLSIFAEVLSYLKTLEELDGEEALVSLGGITFDQDGNVADFITAIQDGKTPLDVLEDVIFSGEGFERALEEVVAGLGKIGVEVNLTDTDLDDDEGVSFPLFESPEKIVDILLQAAGVGAPVPLVQYDLPAQRLSGGFEAALPIFGPILFTLRGGAEAAFDFAVGYDTFALSDDDPNVFDGIYLTTKKLDENEWNVDDRLFEFAPLASASFFLEGGVSLDAVALSATAGGGINGFSGLFLPGGELEPGYQPTADGDGVLRFAELGNCIFDPFFGQVLAELFVEIEAGIGPFSVSWRETLFDRTLLDFDLGICVESNEVDGLASFAAADVVQLHVGPQASLREVEGQLVPGDVEQFNVAAVHDEDGNIVPGAIAVSFLQFTQTLGRAPGEGPIDRITADFGNQKDGLRVDPSLDIAFDILGGANADVINGAARADRLEGGGGRDELLGYGGDDTLLGQGSDDYLEGGAGADFINGGGGSDLVRYDSSPEGVTFTLRKLPSGDTIFDGKGGDAEGDELRSIESVIGSDFDDLLYGNPSGESTLIGRDGADSLIGGTRGDFLVGGAGADLIQGQEGEDGTSYFDSRGGVRVDLQAGTGFGGAAEGDLLFSIEMVAGSIYTDRLLGTVGENTLFGSAGDDFIDGRGGVDSLSGDGGDDTVLGYPEGGSVVFGGYGQDLLDYREATAAVEASLDRGQASIIGGNGTQLIRPDIPLPGQTLFDVTSSFENLSGTAFGDILEGDVSDNVLAGRAGNDELFGLDGEDTILGGLGADTIRGGLGRDLADYADGYIVNVNLATGIGIGSTADGDDIQGIEDLRGTEGADILIGNVTDNRIDPGLARSGSDDSVDGGQDLFSGDTLVLDYAQGDTGLALTGGIGTGRFQRLAANGIDVLDGVTFTDIENFEITGTRLGDVITTGTGADRIYSGGGGDLIDAGSGAVNVLSGADGDTVIYTYEATGPFWLDGGADQDILEIDLSIETADLIVEGTPQDGVNLRLPNGSAAQNFEILAEVKTGAGQDLLRQLGTAENRFDSGDNADILEPGLGGDVVSGGWDFGPETVKIGADLYDLAPGVTEDEILAGQGDLLRLDYTDVTGPIRSEVMRSDSGTIRLAGPAGDTLQLAGTSGTYRTTDGTAEIDFDGIERLSVVGTSLGDVLMGTWRGAVRAAQTGTFQAVDAARGADSLFGDAGDDILIGNTGSDLLRGNAGNDTLVGSDPLLDGGAHPGARFEPRDIYEIDEVAGGAGADLFVLGVVDEGPTPMAQNLYGGRQPGQSDAEDARMRILDFRAADGDRIQLAGEASRYSIEVAGASGRDRHIIETSTGDILGELINPQGFAFIADLVSFVTPATPGWQPSTMPGLFEVPSTAALLNHASDVTAASTPETWVSPTVQAADLTAALFGATGALAMGDLSTSGGARAFGTFAGDPFGLGSGIVLSTGQVADLPGPNTEDGGAFSPQSNTLEFEFLNRVDDINYYRAQVTNLVEGLRTISIADAHIGLTTGAVEGADIDAVLLSRTRLDTVSGPSDFNDLERLEVFDYSAASTKVAPGADTLNGIVNGLVDNSVATLDTVDFIKTTQNNTVSLGNGGALTFELTGPVSTDGPLYIYMAEAGQIEEAVLPGGNSSNGRLAPASDLSTDFGAPGSAGDTITLDYAFDSNGPGVFTLDYVLFTEELVEFALPDFNDRWSVKMNGVELAQLSNGDAATVKSLKPAAVSLDHPDLILNPDLDPGPLRTPGPLAEVFSADAYTKTLTLVAPVVDGENVLTVEVRDVRDGYLDSGIFLANPTLRDGDTATEAKAAILANSAAVPIKESGADTVRFTVNGFAEATAAVTLDITPSAEIDLGAGPGQTLRRVLEPGDDPEIALTALAIADDQAEDTEFATTVVTAQSDDPAFDQIPTQPILVEVEDRSADDLKGTAANDRLQGGASADLITGRSGNDLLSGAGGRDSLIGGQGNDTALGGAGADLIEGGTGPDLLSGNRGPDVIQGDGGADTILGGSGADGLSGGRGRDALSGGRGADTLTGGIGNDALTGGGGPDTFRFALGDGKDAITDYQEGFDTILIAVNLSELSLSQVGDTAVITYGGGDTIRVENTAIDALTLESTLA